MVQINCSSLKTSLQKTIQKCTSQFQNRLPPPPPPRAIPWHLTSVRLRTVGNLTQNEARPEGHLTFVWKRLSAVRNKSILQFFDSAREPRSRFTALVDTTRGFLLLSFYIAISWNMPWFIVWSEDKLNKKFVVAENLAEFVSKGRRFCLYSFISWVTCLEGGGFDPLGSSNGWGIWPSKLAT